MVFFIGNRRESDAVSAQTAWRAAWLKPIPIAAGLTVVLSLVFLAWPAPDIAVARYFAGLEGGFPAADNPVLQTLRGSWMFATRLIIGGLVLIGIAKLIGHRIGRLIDTLDYVFLVATMAIGPGLIVNALLKEVWGRPRPIQTDLFGGAMPFMRAWVPGGACGSNCSFVSGEASSSFWALALVLVAPKDLRPILLPVWAALMGVISVNRLAFGGHYLSDVLIAWGLTGLVIAIGHRWIIAGRGASDVAAAEDALAGLRKRVRSLFQ